MQCNKCGAQIPDDSKFCLVCGCQLNSADAAALVPVKENKLAGKGNILKLAGLALAAVAIIVAIVLYASYAKGISDTEEAISQIGTVSLESLDQIEAAENMVAELSDSARAKVENMDTLTGARKEYERISEMVRDTSEAIERAAACITYTSENQPYVLVDNGDVVKAARSAYDALDNEGFARYVADQLEDLETAEAGYINAHAGQMFLLAYDYEQAGEYQKSIDAYEELLRTYPGHESYSGVSELGIANCYVALGDAAYKEKDYDGAEKLYQQALNTYPSSVDAKNGMLKCTMRDLNALYDKGEYEKVQQGLKNAKGKYGTSDSLKKLEEKLEKKLKDLRPANGKKFDNKIKTGYSKLKVKAGSTDVYVKVVSSDSSKKYVTFYVRAGKTVSIRLANGQYTMEYACGNTWYGNSAKFGEAMVMRKASGELDFGIRRSGSYVYYNEITVTINN